MKTFEQLREEQEQQQLNELLPAAAGAWLIKKAGDAAGWLGGKAKDAAGSAVDQVKKTAKKAWDGGDNKIGAVKGSDEKGLPKSS